MLFLSIKTAITGKVRVVYDIDLSYLVAVREYVYHGHTVVFELLSDRKKFKRVLKSNIKTLRGNS